MELISKQGFPNEISDRNKALESEIATLKSQDLGKLKNIIQKMKGEIARLSNERDQLIQISSELRYKLNQSKNNIEPEL